LTREDDEAAGRFLRRLVSTTSGNLRDLMLRRTLRLNQEEVHFPLQLEDAFLRAHPGVVALASSRSFASTVSALMRMLGMLKRRLIRVQNRDWRGIGVLDVKIRNATAAPALHHRHVAAFIRVNDLDIR
jgi:hypothetical protein